MEGLLSDSGGEEPKEIKGKPVTICLVGDGAVGKTCMLLSWAKN